MEWLSQPETWFGLLALIALEIVLGIDNIVFISILAGRLPPELRLKAMRTGLALAMFVRILLLLGIGWIVSLTAPLFNVAGHDISGRDLILIGGGLFLLYKSTVEIHHKLEGPDPHLNSAAATATFAAVIGQILLIDIVFSLDSVITAVGMVKHVEIMIAAVVISILFMLIFANPVSKFVEAHPSIKMLALAFLVLIGVNLIAEGFHQHIPKGYTYFAMAFSLGVEVLNIRARRTREGAVKLHGPTLP